MADVAKLIAKQAASWELKRRLEEQGKRSGRCIVAGVAYGPCLLISREHGSAGDTVAHIMGERLGWQVFDREIVDEIAHRTQVREQLIRCVDEKTRSTWVDTFRSMLQPEDIGRDTYLLYLRNIVRTLGHHGDVIIIGRGAHYILPAQCSLRVRFVAPQEVRARYIADKEGLSLEQARRDVQKVDADRAAFVQKTFLHNSALSENYDRVINSGELSAEAAAEIVLTALSQKLGVHPQKQP